MIMLAGLAVLAVTLAGGDAAVPAQPAQATDSSRDRFTRLVQDYWMYVTPLCAPELAAAYRNFNDERDRAFRQSLARTDLQDRYLSAVRERNALERRTVRHCQGPPPPPPPPGTTASLMDPRAIAIQSVQDRLRSNADAIPRYFDEGDRIFADLVALRDEIIGGEER